MPTARISHSAPQFRYGLPETSLLSLTRAAGMRRAELGRTYPQNVPQILIDSQRTLGPKTFSDS